MIKMNFKIMLVLISALFYSSCAYYNTFYNTKKLYKEAKGERDKRQTDVPGPTEKKKYDDTISKASKILEFHPNSKYVDDAVMILGECFYYKEEYIKAQRKFQELIKFFPESDFYFNAKVWLAKTNIKLNDYASARLILTELTEKTKLEKDIREESKFLLGEIYFQQKNYKEAEREFSETVDIAKNELTKANSYYQLGQTQLQNEKYTDAVENFKLAIKYSTDQNFEFDAWLNYARALKLSKNYKLAMRTSNELLENQAFKNQQGHIQLEIANIIYEEGKSLFDKLDKANIDFTGKIQEALESYELVILQNKRTEVSAAAYFKIGQINEFDLHHFPGAKENYEKVKTEYNRSEYAEDAEKRAKDIGDLIKFSNEVKKALGQQLIESSGSQNLLSELELLLLEHGDHPELRFMAAKRKPGVPDSDANQPDKIGEEARGAAKLNSLVKSKLQLAEIYLFQFAQVDSAIFQYKEILEHFPDHPNSAKALYSVAYIYENVYQNKFKTDSLLYQVIQNYPDSEQAKEARHKLDFRNSDSYEPAAELFRRAENSLLKSNNVNQALEDYKKVLDTYPDTEFAPKALYALGWIHERYTGDYDKAKDLYKEFVEKYPESEFVTKIKSKITAKLPEEKKDTDSKPGKEAISSNPGADMESKPLPESTDSKKDIESESQREVDANEKAEQDQENNNSSPKEDID